MKRNMFMALLEHERIITTEPKAKELRRFAEKLITLAKRGLVGNDPIKSLHARRLVMARLGPVAKVHLHDDKGNVTEQTVVGKLFSDVAPRYVTRPGGYTRIIKRHERRLGDAGATAFIELLKEGEEKVRAKGEKQAVAPAPAPVVVAPPVQAVTPPTPEPAPATPETTLPAPPAAS